MTDGILYMWALYWAFAEHAFHLQAYIMAFVGLQIHLVNHLQVCHPTIGNGA